MVTPAYGDGSVFGRYLLGHRIGVGGMGEVFLAVQRGLEGFERVYAMKLLLPHLGESPEQVSAFLSEARLAASMSHPNVVSVFDVGRESGRYFMVLELVNGVSLSKLTRAGALPAGAVIEIAQQLAQGLAYSHQLADTAGQPLGLVHRDVTPHNVLVSMQGEAKLTDFGIAKTSQTPDVTETGVLKGKLDYLPPEALAGARLDQRSDQYGFALCIYSTATGRSPFVRETTSATLRAIEAEVLPPLSAQRPDVPAQLSAVVARALAKRPADRYPSLEALRRELPAAPPGTRELLASAVRSRFATELVELEHHTAQIRRRQTAPLPAPGQTATLPHRRRTGALLLAAAAVAVVAAAAATSGLWRGGDPAVRAEQAPVANEAPAPATPSPQPEPAAEPEPPPPAPLAAPQARLPKVRKDAALAIGYLNVDAFPWAQVFVDGKRVGDTPLARVAVGAGRHQVVLKNPETNKEQSRTVTVKPGETTRVWERLQ